MNLVRPRISQPPKVPAFHLGGKKKEKKIKKKKKFKTSITFFVCLGLKHAEKFFGGYKIKIFFYRSLIFF